LVKLVIHSVVASAAWVTVVVLLGVAAAAGLALLRGGDFHHELGLTLWAVGALMLIVGVVGYSPSVQRSAEEVPRWTAGRRFGAPNRAPSLDVTLVLIIGSLGVLGIAYVVNSGS
jgi:hypothetical protein